MDALIGSSNNGRHFEQASGEALVAGKSGPFYCLLPWDVAACESPEGICGKDHLRRRNRRSRARITVQPRPISATRDQLSERFPSLSTTTTVVPSSACRGS
jgi:hypothetical protein